MEAKQNRKFVLYFPLVSNVQLFISQEAGLQHMQQLLQKTSVTVSNGVLPCHHRFLLGFISEQASYDMEHPSGQFGQLSWLCALCQPTYEGEC